MANNVYIGNRYVPIFDGPWNDRKSYDPLVIVEFGNNTYTSKKPVPAGTLPTNTTYWALTGNYNGQIAGLDTRVSAIETALAATPKNRKFILVGDSFGYGVKGDSSPWTTGWIDYMHNLFPNDTYFYHPASDPTFPGTAAFLGTTTFLSIFQWILANKMSGVDLGTITDVIVLGGSNEPDNQTAAIASDIQNTFIPAVRQACPNARIGIGVVGLNANLLYSKAYLGYKKGALAGGAEFLGDLLNLGTLPSMASSAGHWSNAGYALYNPFIAHCVIYGHVSFKWSIAYNLTLNTTDWINGYGNNVGYILYLTVSEKSVYALIINNLKYNGWFIQNKKSWSSGTLASVLFNTPAIYVHIANGSNCCCGRFIDRLSGNNLAPVSVQLLQSTGNTFTINVNAFILINPTNSVNTNIIFAWDAIPILCDTEFDPT